MSFSSIINSNLFTTSLALAYIQNLTTLPSSSVSIPINAQLPLTWNIVIVSLLSSLHPSCTFHSISITVILKGWIQIMLLFIYVNPPNVSLFFTVKAKILTTVAWKADPSSDLLLMPVFLPLFQLFWPTFLFFDYARDISSSRCLHFLFFLPGKLFRYILMAPPLPPPPPALSHHLFLAII